MGCMSNKKIVVSKKKEDVDVSVSKDNKTKENSQININVNLKVRKPSFKTRYSVFTKKMTNDVRDNYLVMSKIGNGGNGSVFKVQHLISHQTRAMKVIKKETLRFQEGDQSFLREIDLLKLTDHPNIIRIFEYYEDPINYYVIEELISGGELYDTISKWKEFTEDKAAHILYQIMTAVNYLHSTLKIIHRDIKPENILVEKINNDEKRINIKLIDFGTGNFFENNQKFSHRVGTPYYIAPEVLDKFYNEKADIWSCGVILYMLLVGYPPFTGKNVKEIINSVKNGKYDMSTRDWMNISSDAKDLVDKMLTYDPEKRISAKEVLDHPFLKTVFTVMNNEAEKKVVQVLKNIQSFNVKEKFQQATLAYIVHYILTGAELEEIQKVFHLLDKKGEGRLSYEAVIEGYEKVFGKNFSEEEVKSIITTMDGDDNGYIEYQEFLRAALNKRKLISEENLRLAFDRFDEDGDGKLSAKEIKEVFQTDDIEIIAELVKCVNMNEVGEISYDEFCSMMRKIVQDSLGESMSTSSALYVSNITQNGKTTIVPNNLASRRVSVITKLDIIYTQWVYGRNAVPYCSMPHLSVKKRFNTRFSKEMFKSKDTNNITYYGLKEDIFDLDKLKI